MLNIYVVSSSGAQGSLAEFHSAIKFCTAVGSAAGWRTVTTSSSPEDELSGFKDVGRGNIVWPQLFVRWGIKKSMR